MVKCFSTMDPTTIEPTTMEPRESFAPPVTLVHEEFLENVMDSTLPLVHYVDLAPHLAFLSSSTAFASFIDALYDLAYPSFFSKARSSVKSTMRSAEASEDAVTVLEGHRLLSILLEMKSCLEHNNSRIFFSLSPVETSIGVLNRMKLTIEASTAAEWDWWPLQPASHLADNERAEISWQCVRSIENHDYSYRITSG